MSDLKALIDDAATQCSQQECEAAIRALEGAAQLAPEDWWIQYQLGFCLAGGCHRHSLADPDVALYHLQKALSLSPGSAVEGTASVLAALGNTYLASHQLPLKARVTAAVECQEKAAAIFESEGDLDKWAREEYNLGNAWCEFPEDSFPDKWQHAIEHYTAALQVWTRDQDPKRHAKVLQNLGTAYRELPIGDRQQNIRQAMICYREALRVYKCQEFPRENSSVHNNIGTALLSLLAADPRRSIRRAQMALRHFERSLKVLPREEAPDVYAIAQFNCGQALLRLAASGQNPGLHLWRAHLLFSEARNWFLLDGQDALAESATDRLQTVDVLFSKLGQGEELLPPSSSGLLEQTNSTGQAKRALGNRAA
jgi:tetratricopeptide (TPR) repeat protein